MVLDPSPASSSAACVAVRAGATSDPPSVRGLAHFCEHMLFLGTKKYPKEDEFEAFLSASGGSSNAYTSSEDTVYYFDLSSGGNAVFNEALDRFGSFFSSPLFTRTATDRELNAINSEHAKNLQNDSFRSYQLEKATVVNQAHPYSKFFTGNKKTLLDDTRAAGIDLREQLVQFYNTYYSANLMTAAVVIPSSLVDGDVKKLIPVVEKAFGDVPNLDISPPELKWADVPAFIAAANLFIVEAVPVQELRQLSISFPFSTITGTEMDLRIKPELYLSHLIGHEGKGSILSLLKSKGWANSVSAGRGNTLSDFFTFEVGVDLTEEGLSHYTEVIGVIYSYIDMLRKKKAPDYTFDEVLWAAELSFWRFAPNLSATTAAGELAPAIYNYGRSVGPGLVIAGPRRLDVTDDMTKAPRSAFRPGGREEARKAISGMLEKMVPENGITSVVSKSFLGLTDKVEPVYGTEYRNRPISESLLKLWDSAEAASRLGMDYPRRNVFLPTESGLAFRGKMVLAETGSRGLEERMTPVPPPEVIRSDSRWTVRFKQDNKFGKPKAYLIFELVTGEAFVNAKDAALSQFYTVAATDALNEYAYDATLAGMSYTLQVLPRGVRITFGGYNEKLGAFASYISRKLAIESDSVLPKSARELERYRDELLRGSASFYVGQPYSHAIYFSKLLVTPEPFTFPVDGVREALRTITMQDLKEYSKKLWRRGRGEALIQGNLLQKEALEVVQEIDKALNFEAADEAEAPKRFRAIRLPKVSGGVSLIRSSEFNKENNNAAVQVVIQCDGKGDKNHVLIEVISAIISEPFYEELRTRQQLGYIVSSGVKALEETRNLNLVVQSTIAPAEKLTTKVLGFLDAFRKDRLEKLTEADVTRFVKGVIERKTDPEKDLIIEVTRNWAEIVSGRYKFDRPQAEAAVLLEVNKLDVLEFWDKFISAKAPAGRRILVSEVVPEVGAAVSERPQMSYTNPSGYTGNNPLRLGADDVESYRRERQQLEE